VEFSVWNYNTGKTGRISAVCTQQTWGKHSDSACLLWYDMNSKLSDLQGLLGLFKRKLRLSAAVRPRLWGSGGILKANVR
jgi:hypothetical protein